MARSSFIFFVEIFNSPMDGVKKWRVGESMGIFASVYGIQLANWSEAEISQ